VVDEDIDLFLVSGYVASSVLLHGIETGLTLRAICHLQTPDIVGVISILVL
jgi:hypothetical protein